MLLETFQAAVDAAAPKFCVPKYLPDKPKGRTVVIGFGKSAAAMAKAVEDSWEGDVEGVVVTRYGHAVECQKIKVLEASHPVPDQACVDATNEIINTVQGLKEDDLVLCLASGGGSALFMMPPEGVTLHDKQKLTQDMLACGATITEINTVRKHLSQVKGGRLAKTCSPARVVSLMISDVPGDDLAFIASGPTVPDETSAQDVQDILNRYQVELSESLQTFLKSPEAETIKPHDPLFDQVQNTLIATPQMSLEAAAEIAKRNGITPMILSDRVEGESREVAKVMAAIALQVAERNQPLATPALILSGGETTVSIQGNGRGGPNTEFLLSLAIALNGAPGIYAIACDTDGIDGSEDNAGAMIGPDTLAKAQAAGLNPKKYLANNDAYSFFETLDALVIPGPTLTNVNDFRAIYVGE
ncbi:MAG: glycerate kinase [Rhodospirillales bacterium]|nr:glycerate kinase [Rhodospirillales bacterium]